jgi:hypothetical protein
MVEKRKIFGPKKERLTGEWRRIHNGDFMLCTVHQISFG